jgi:hypothetical protein
MRALRKIICFTNKDTGNRPQKFYMSKRFSIIAGILVAILLIASTIISGDDPSDEKRVWKGEVEINYSRIGHYEGSNTNNPRINAHTKYDEQLEAKVVIGGCVNGGVYKWLESNDFYYKRSDKANWRRDHELCEDRERRTSWMAKPGDSWEAEQAIGGELDMSSEAQVMLFLMVLPEGNYSLTAAGGYPYRVTHNSFEAETNACTGKTKNTTTILAPDFGEGMGGITEEGESTVIRGQSYPLTLPLAVGYRGKIEGDVIKGNTVIIDKTESARTHLKYARGINEGQGELHEIMTASWHYEAVDPCDQVMHQLNQSMAFLAAYNNVTLLNQGLDGEAYDAEVGKLAGKIYAETVGDDGGQAAGQARYEAGTDLGVNLDCELVRENEYKESNRRSCKPEIITNAIIAHEMTHVAQCNESKALFTRGQHDPQLQSKYEIEAYCTEIYMLFDWMDRNCNTDLSGQEELADYICK